jgi:hypothetical protein
MNRTIPIEFLRNLFSYCPLTGILSYKQGAGPAKPGDEAGSRNKKGYRYVKVSWEGQRIQIMSHVIAWAIHYGMWPVGDVDHENTVRDNNWIANLRQASRSQNLANRRNIGALPKGVTFDKGCAKKPYRAQIQISKGKNKYLGNYTDPADAHAIYMFHAVNLYGEFARAK